MMTVKRRKRAVTVITVTIALIMFGAMIFKIVVQPVVENTFNYVFYNDTTSEGAEYNNSGDILDANFSSEMLAPAAEVVRNNPAENADYFMKDLKDRVYNEIQNSGDPSLLAELALDATLKVPEYLPKGGLLSEDKQSVEMWEKVVFGFIDNPKDHMRTAASLFAVWQKAERVEVREITDGYTSMAYQRPEAGVLNASQAERLGRETIPLPYLANTPGTSGWEIRFIFKNGAELGYRINCGYQPDARDWAQKPAEPVKLTPQKPPKKPVEPPKKPVEPVKPTPQKPPKKPVEPPKTPPKTGREPTPDGVGYKGKSNNAGNPPEIKQPIPDTTVNPNTPPGGADTEGQAVAPGATDDGEDRYVPPVQPKANPPANSNSGSEEEPANNGSAGDPNAIP